MRAKHDEPGRFMAMAMLFACACSGGSVSSPGSDAAPPAADGGADVAAAADARADSTPPPPGDAASDGDGAPACTFTLTGDTITDSSTGLQWAAHITGPESWSDAYSACGTWGGRLPLETQLAGIVEPVRECVAAGLITWDGPPQGQAAWTITPDPINQGDYYTVYFDGTPPVSAPPSALEWVRCVK